MSLAGGGQRNTVASLTISMCQRSRTVKAEAHELRSEPRMTIKRGARCETVASVSTSSCLGSLAMVMEANALRTELRSMSEGGLVQNYCRRIHLLMPELTYAGNRSQRASFRADVDNRGKIDATQMPAYPLLVPRLERNSGRSPRASFLADRQARG